MTSNTETGQAAEAILKRDYTGSRLLLAEDDPFNQELVKILLEEVGLVVDVAENGAVALQFASENDYAAILMDMQMPVMDGLEATARIRELARHKQTPILAVTANAFAEDQARCLEAGMDDFVAKPISPEILYASLLNGLSKRQP